MVSNRPFPNVLMIAEYPKESGAPTGMLASDLQKDLVEKGNRAWIFHAPGRYKPGGLGYVRLRNFIVLHFLTPFAILLTQLFSLLTGKRLVVVATTSPPLIHWTTQVFGFLFGARVLTWYQDAHPEIESRILAARNFRFAAGFLRLLDKLFMWFSHCVVTLDRGMSIDLKRRCPSTKNIVAIPPWATFVEPAVAFRAPQKKSKIKILYAGNYGKAHDLSPFVELLKKQPLHVQSQLDFTFVGMNAESAATLKKLFSGINVSQAFLPRFQHLDDLFKIMRTVDFGLVSLNPQFFGVMCPSKAYTYLSQGTPILYAGPADSLSDELCEQGWGYTTNQLIDIVASSEKDFNLNENDGVIFQNPRQPALNAIKQCLQNFN